MARDAYWPLMAVNGCRSFKWLRPLYVVALSQIAGSHAFPFHAAKHSVYQARSRRIFLPLALPVLSYFKLHLGLDIHVRASVVQSVYLLQLP
jgi:hypothetical protein